MPPLWDVIWNEHYLRRITRPITFRNATAFVSSSPSGPTIQYAPDQVVPAGIRYMSIGLRLNRGVLMPVDHVEIHIWLRDWFARATDDATPAELQQMVTSIRGQINSGNGDKELYSRFTLDGLSLLKYDWHGWDHRPDGKVFAILVRLQAA